MDFEINAPPEIVAAFRDGRRSAGWIEAFCPVCTDGHRRRVRKLRAGIYMGKPWWGCMRCHCEKDYKAAQKSARFRAENMRGTNAQDARRSRERAIQTFERTSAISQGDFAHRYLTVTRDLSLQSNVAPSDLRRGRTYNHEYKERGISTEPLCMIAAVRDVAGSLIAIHRTYLFELPDGRVVKLSDLEVPDNWRVIETKKSLSATLGGAIRLGIDSDEIGLCEGIESALGMSSALGLVCWATISAPGMTGLLLPKNITRVVIGPDVGDRDGIGARSAEVLQQRLYREARVQGRQLIVKIKPPPIGYSDWGEIRSKK